MKVYKLEPNKAGYVKEIDNTLEVLQKEVGGYIQVCYLDNGLLAIVDEEGKLKDLPYNVIIPNYGIINGNIIFARDGGEDFTSLTDEDIKAIKKMIYFEE
jgi:hypothetical protein